MRNSRTSGHLGWTSNPRPGPADAGLAASGSLARPAHTFSLLIPLLLVILLPGCNTQGPEGTRAGREPPRSEAAPWFEEVAAEVGIDFQHQSGHQPGRYPFPEVACGGGALVDVNGDGYLDLYLVQSGSLYLPPDQRPGNRLYLNRGDGTFQDATEGSGTDDRGYGMGVTAGDYDNDGDLDLYVTNLERNTLLRNEGNGKFRDVTEQAGVGGKGWSTSAVMLDYDRDGDLDLYVVNYVRWSLTAEHVCYNNRGERTYCGPNLYGPLPDTLYRNNGDGTFTDVSAEAGILSAAGNGLGVVCGDFDGDGWLDIYVANDLTPNILWHNQQGKGFRNVAPQWGCAVSDEGVPKAGMGVVAEDLDYDGDLDLMVVNLSNETDSFFRNEGGFFMDCSPTIGALAATLPFTRFGLVMADFDHDGFLDAYVANGRINTRLPPVVPEDPLAEPNVLLRGTAEGKLVPVTPIGGTLRRLLHTSRAAIAGDIDNDGAIDLVVVNKDARPYVLRNVVAGRTGNHWLLITLVDRHGRLPLHATVTGKLGDRTVRRDCRIAYSYCAASDARIHIGLGRHRQLQQVTVQWPDGAVETFGSIQADRHITLQQGTGQGLAAAEGHPDEP